MERSALTAASVTEPTVSEEQFRFANEEMLRAYERGRDTDRQPNLRVALLCPNEWHAKCLERLPKDLARYIRSEISEDQE